MKKVSNFSAHITLKLKVFLYPTSQLVLQIGLPWAVKSSQTTKMPVFPHTQKNKASPGDGKKTQKVNLITPAIGTAFFRRTLLEDNHRKLRY